MSARTDIERASRSRAALRAQAQLLGWIDVPVLGVWRDEDGRLVIIERDGSRIVAEPVGTIAAQTPEDVADIAPKGKRVYAPKTWAPKAWNRMRDGFIGRPTPKSTVLAEMQKKRDAAEGDDRKPFVQAIGVLEALPDGPDWAEHLPIAEVTDS